MRLMRQGKNVEKLKGNWRKSRRAEDLVMFKRLKNYVTHLINKARRDFYTEFVNENSSNQTNLFRAANKLLALKNNNVSFPKQMDRNILVNDIGKFFVHKIIKVRAEIDSTDVYEIDRALVPTNPQIDDEIQVMESFQLLDEKDFSTLIRKSAKKTCKSDPMPIYFINY